MATTQQIVVNPPLPPLPSGYLSKTYKDPNPGWRPRNTNLPEVNSRWKNKRTGLTCAVTRVKYAMDDIIDLIFDDGEQYSITPNELHWLFEKC